MDIVHDRCCGLDIHKKTVVACLIAPGPDGKPKKEIRSFGTMTGDLLGMADWLQRAGCTHVAMESTGVYWKPIYNVLESTGMELLVVNAQHIKAVPGRKTDVKDAEWIADLLKHGLVRASFIPSRPQRELRELVRYRKGLTEQRGHVVQRIQKLLEGANIKLSDVASDVVGVSGLTMLRALAAGEQDAERLAEMAKSQLRNKREELKLALRGSFGEHQRFMLKNQLGLLEFLDEQIAELNQEVERRLRPFETLLERLRAIPGIGPRNSEQILVEVGTDMNRFPTDSHFASWAKLCPGNDESAGKRMSGRTGQGSRWLRAPWWKPPGLPLGSATAISPPSTTDWSLAAASVGRRSPSPTACSSSSTTSSKTAPSTKTSVRGTSTNWTASASPAEPFKGSSPWASTSPSKRSRR